MPERTVEKSTESDGRSIEIDTGHYRVQVWGDPDDDLDDLMDQLTDAADRAKADLKELDKHANATPRQYD